MPRKNPLDAYKQSRQASLTGQDVEVAVLERAAMNFRVLQKDWIEGTKFNRGLDSAVKYNQRVWDIFQSDWKGDECNLPNELRQNLLSLSVFVRKASLDLLANPTPAKMEVLVNINENIATGLSEGRSKNDSKSPSASSGKPDSDDKKISGNSA